MRWVILELDLYVRTHITQIVLCCWLNLMVGFKLYFDSCVDNIVNFSADVSKAVHFLRYSLINQRRQRHVPFKLKPDCEALFHVGKSLHGWLLVFSPLVTSKP